MNDVFDGFKEGEAPAGRSRRRAQRRALLVICVIVALIAAVAVVVIPNVFGGASQTSDYEGAGTGEVTVTIPEGASGREIGSILADAGVVASEGAFVNAWGKDARAASIQPGTYKLATHMSAGSAISALLDPNSVAAIKIVIPEGFTRWQVSARLAKAFGVSEDEVKALMDKPADLGVPAEANGEIEGWLAPATYSFDSKKPVADALREMVKARLAVLDRLDIPRDQWEPSLIKASIVERESNAESYTKVARVIENRLADDNGEVRGRLQMDSTVLYGAQKTGGVPTKDELQADTPWNTYTRKGLPPSPIGAAGEDALKAVQSPAEGDWLYFTTVNLETGETKFTNNYDEQKKFQQEFRDWLAAHPQK